MHHEANETLLGAKCVHPTPIYKQDKMSTSNHKQSDIWSTVTGESNNMVICITDTHLTMISDNQAEPWRAPWAWKIHHGPLHLADSFITKIHFFAQDWPSSKTLDNDTLEGFPGEHPEPCAGYVKQAKVAATLEDIAYRMMYPIRRPPRKWETVLGAQICEKFECKQ